MQKQQLRARMKALRAACEDRRALDNGIFENLFSQPFMNAETFFVYVSFGSEADTRRIIEELFKRGKTVFLPRVAGQRMQCVRYVGPSARKGRVRHYGTARGRRRNCARRMPDASFWRLTGAVRGWATAGDTTTGFLWTSSCAKSGSPILFRS